jgi:endonuclease/exonuclease/phosphatase family metal-dependent hydrolase
MNFGPRIQAIPRRTGFPRAKRIATVVDVDSPFRIAAFNAENFSLLLDRTYTRDELEALSESDYLAMNPSIFNPNKERAKIAAIGDMVRRGDYDMIGLCEVGGRESLAAFNKLYLDGRYEVYLHEENSKRGIFVGALVKRGRFSWVRAANMPGAFARNLLKITLGQDRGGVEIFVVHLKSQYGQDRGLEHRIKEIDKLCSLVRSQKCIVMGDFNGILIRGEAQFEYEPFLALPFRDVLEAVGVPPDERRTHYHFGPDPHFTQLDYIFCSNDLQVIEAGVVEGEIPLNKTQRNYLPSDHLMIHATVALPGEQPTTTGSSLVQTPETDPAKLSWWKRLWTRLKFF